MAASGPRTVLCVAAHPDDEVLGCGATIARRSLAGDSLYIAILGEGITARSDSRDHADQNAIERLRETAALVGAFLGAKSVVQLTLPDNRFDTVARLDIVKIVERLIDQVEPDVIYTHHVGDLNVDHRLTAEAVLTATRPTAGLRVRELYAWETPSSTEWSFQQIEPRFQPNVFTEIASTLNRKIKAMEMYEREVRPFPHPRSPQALRAIAERWGTVSGCMAAEAFQLIRRVE